MKEDSQIDQKRLSIEQMAKLLSAASGTPVTVEQITADLKAGAPTNQDGTINLLHYTAWLAKEMSRRVN